jgi:hypothetical protein
MTYISKNRKDTLQMSKKRLLIFLCVLIIAGIANAQQQVSENEARNAAINTLYDKTAILNKRSYSEIDTVFSSYNSRSNVLMYEVVFKNNTAILLSGSKACLPVLGYYIKPDNDDSAIFDTTHNNVPCCLQAFLYDYIQEIEWCFAQDNITLYFEEQWRKLQQFDSIRGDPPTTISVAPLLTTKWNQSESNDWKCDAYNYFITNTNNSCSCTKHCPVGCVAVAMGQIMKYWNYPVYLPDNDYQYDWCNMRDELLLWFEPYHPLNQSPFWIENPNYEKERNAIARLLKDCGERAKMEYCRKNDCLSGASNSDARKALVNDFGYNKNADLQRRFWWSDNTWKGRIKENLNQAQPVYYSGSGSGGHAFVCDGYGNDDLFHFNWGWNGVYDGWFTIDNLTPGGGDFNSSQQAIFYIKPDKSQDYCNYHFSLLDHYSSGGTHQNVPQTFTSLVSVPENYNASWRTIPPGQSARYVAHKRILIQPGFKADAGSSFVARIDPCDDCETGTKSMNFTNPINKSEQTTEYFNESTFNEENYLQGETYKKDIKLYPNPNPGTFQLETNFPLSEISNLKITNTLGVTVYETQYLNSHEIQLQKTNTGLHFVVIFLKDGTLLTQKMMVQR